MARLSPGQIDSYYKARHGVHLDLWHVDLLMRCVTVHIHKSNPSRYGHGIRQTVSRMARPTDPGRLIYASTVSFYQRDCASMDGIWRSGIDFLMRIKASVGVQSTEMRRRSLVSNCGVEHRDRQRSCPILCSCSLEAASSAVVAAEGDLSVWNQDWACLVQPECGIVNDRK